MRLGIKGKQVLGVSSIVGAVVVILSVLDLARVASVRLDESRAHADLLANAIYHRARAARPRPFSPPPLQPPPQAPKPPLRHRALRNPRP